MDVNTVCRDDDDWFVIRCSMYNKIHSILCCSLLEWHAVIAHDRSIILPHEKSWMFLLLMLNEGPLIGGCLHPYTVDNNLLYSLSLKLQLVDRNGKVVSSAADALVGSPTEQFKVPIVDQPFSILFRNDDDVVCKDWRIIGFRITVENVLWYKVRVGQLVSRKVQVCAGA